MSEASEKAFKLGIFGHVDKVERCESDAEIYALPILLNVCKKLNLDLTLQEEIEYPCDFYDWVYDRYGDPDNMPTWLQRIHERECGEGCRMCNYWKTGELYRIDFVVRPKDGECKIAVEIDGERYHDKRKDAERDERLDEDYGYDVYRIAARDVFQNPLEVEESLINYIKSKI